MERRKEREEGLLQTVNRVRVSGLLAFNRLNTVSHALSPGDERSASLSSLVCVTGKGFLTLDVFGKKLTVTVSSGF